MPTHYCPLTFRQEHLDETLRRGGGWDSGRSLVGGGGGGGDGDEGDASGEGGVCWLGGAKWEVH